MDRNTLEFIWFGLGNTLEIFWFNSLFYRQEDRASERGNVFSKSLSEQRTRCQMSIYQFSQFSHSVVWLFATPWIAARQASLSITNCFTAVLTFAYFEGLTLLSTISPKCCLSILGPIWYHCWCPRHTSALKCASPGPCVCCWIFWKRTIVASF